MELIREIIVPTENTYLLNLPDEMIGKKVEVIAFEIEDVSVDDFERKKERLAEISEIFKDSSIDLSNFKFDRDQANNYDE